MLIGYLGGSVARMEAVPGAPCVDMDIKVALLKLGRSLLLGSIICIVRFTGV